MKIVKYYLVDILMWYVILLDKWNPQKDEKASKAAEKLEELKAELNLVDIWRMLTP